MALTRKFLSAMGIEDEKIDEIITAHSETVNGLKEQIDDYKEKAEKLPSVEKELNELKQQAGGENAWKVKYEKVKGDFEDYKKGIEAEKSKATKTDAYKALLKEIGVADKYVDTILKVTDLNGIEIEDGKVKADSEALKTEWADFIATETTEGANTANPPAQKQSVDYDKMSDEDYYKATYAKGN